MGIGSSAAARGDGGVGGGEGGGRVAAGGGCAAGRRELGRREACEVGLRFCRTVGVELDGVGSVGVGRPIAPDEVDTTLGERKGSAGSAAARE